MFEAFIVKENKYLNFHNDTYTYRTSGTILLFQKKIQFTLQCGLIGPGGRLNWAVQIITGYSLNVNKNACLPIHWLNIICFD